MRRRVRSRAFAIHKIRIQIKSENQNERKSTASKRVLVVGRRAWVEVAGGRVAWAAVVDLMRLSYCFMLN